ncbi:hypothetical protein [Actinomadura harenae]|nr:hypothetical protein [Actinomadura harenae]
MRVRPARHVAVGRAAHRTLVTTLLLIVIVLATGLVAGLRWLADRRTRR